MRQVFSFTIIYLSASFEMGTDPFAVYDECAQLFIDPSEHHYTTQTSLLIFV